MRRRPESRAISTASSRSGVNADAVPEPSPVEADAIGLTSRRAAYRLQGHDLGPELTRLAGERNGGPRIDLRAEQVGERRVDLVGVEYAAGRRPARCPLVRDGDGDR